MARAASATIAEAVEALRAGELVAFPTETVYGLGANAADPLAVARIFALKGRPADHPLIVHLGSQHHLHEWARELPPVAARLADEFWPGPLTLILPKAPHVNTVVTGGQDSIGIRVPSHPIAQQLLAAFGGGIAAPSANRYGRLSPTRAEHVREEFGDKVRVLLDGGESQIGLESTIVACLGHGARLLRPGSITRTQIEQVIGELDQGADAAPRASGDRPQHYAPRTRLQIVAGEALDAHAARLASGGHRVAVLAMHGAARAAPNVVWIDAGGQPAAYAHNLYDNLRTLDRMDCGWILVEAPPAHEEWSAVLDRLQRASEQDGNDAP
ncbi:MAG: L-threonylcarbamoyladenylate synthase [Steroidobacterales bacterium]